MTNKFKGKGVYSGKNKLNLDKYYTPAHIAEYCVNKTLEVIGTENITEIIEPSAGGGVFLNYLPKETLAYDIEPEDERITKQDFLKLDLKYKKGRLIIGNPPYGCSNNLSLQFCNKSFEHSDYISFILPISQLNNTQSIYKFDLIYSEQLEVVEYSGIKVATCLNIYQRPKNGILNKKAKPDKSLIDIQNNRRGGNPSLVLSDYDLAICAWGGSLGKEIEYQGQYAHEFYIIVKDKDRKQEIVDYIKSINWREKYNMAFFSVNMWMIYETVNEKFLINKQDKTLTSFFNK